MTRPGLPRLPRARGRAAVALAATLALTPLVGACGTQAGAAAVVGDRRISVGELQTATDQIHHLQGAEQASQGQVLLLLIAEPFVVDAASKAQVGVSESDARSALRGAVDEPAPPTIAVMRANLALAALEKSQGGQEALRQVLDQVSKASPRINPRYGRLDANQGAIVPVTSNWIAPSPAATPAPSPSS